MYFRILNGGMEAKCEPVGIRECEFFPVGRFLSISDSTLKYRDFALQSTDVGQTKTHI